MPNAFGIADDILITDFDKQGRDHDATLGKVLRVFRKANLKLNKDRCLFKCRSIPFFAEVVSCQGVILDPRKVQALRDMLPQNTRMICKHFLVY